MRKKYIITESQLKVIKEQQVYAEIDYSSLLNKNYPFFNDKKEGKQKPVFVGKIKSIEPKIKGVARAISYALPGKTFHEYKIEQNFILEIIDSNIKQFEKGKEYEFIYYCEYRSFKHTPDFNPTLSGRYYENFELTKVLSKVCSDTGMKTTGIINIKL